MKVPITSSLAPFFNGSITRLSYVIRYSGSPVLRRENVAEHGYWVAMIGATIALDMGHPVHVAERISLRGLLHDVEESLVGDIIRNTKYFSHEVREAMRTVEDAKADQIFEELRWPGEVFKSIWKLAKDDSFEGQVLKLADLLSVAVYCYQEMELGNDSLDIRGIVEDVCRNIMLWFPDDTDLGKYARDIIFGIFDWIVEVEIIDE